jgi:hypothetical protein
MQFGIFLILAAVFGQAQPTQDAAVRDAFRRAALKYILTASRVETQMGTTDQSTRDRDNAFDDLTIESSSPEEKSVSKVAQTFALNVQANNTMRALIRTQWDLDELLGPLQIDAYQADFQQIFAREDACSNALKQMLDQRLNTDIPECKHVAVIKSDLKTRFVKLPD